MSNRILIAALAVLGATAPAMADPITVSARPTTFNSLEYDYSGQERIDRANDYLHASIPVGSSVADARTLLRKAGARCSTKPAAQLRCTAESFETVESVLHDVNWTVDVDHQGDTVTGLSVDRQSFGS
jgi:hypothetical protein